jgi:hypothetical protein
VTEPTFSEFAPGVGVGDKCPNDWYSIADLPLTILIGVTGVGKSTTVDALAEIFEFTQLPNRRMLTDHMIITPMLITDGQPILPVTDRSQRFDYTRRYRKANPGGMAHALAGICIDPAKHSGLILFDGLRGVNEVKYAIETLPLARFVVLFAPDVVRVQRLLGRNDAFDQIDLDSTGQGASDDKLTGFADLGLGEARKIFDPGDEARLLALANRNDVSADDLAAKLRIVIEERRNYDPAATRALVAELAPFRSVEIDTAKRSPEDAAIRISQKLEI